MLLKKIIEAISQEPTGKLLDLGCASGHYSLELAKLGFSVTATDVTNRFLYSDKIKFVQFDSNKPLPFENESFDYVLLAEVIEHLKAPFAAILEINRILKSRGKLFLSTPNILNLESRMRFLFEGTYEYFREPPLDHVTHCRETGIDDSQVHIVPYRYHELEFLLKDCGFDISKISTSTLEGRNLSFLIPIIKLQMSSKKRRSIKKGGIDYRRINQILLSKELLFGRHLIVKAEKIF
ncbi:MAG TPA: hypothetical protein DD723_09980 [Candidatus Omnitrophica bacterium]|nr:hypothetical protein [Candidatus Omnitrophota bacterium]